MVKKVIKNILISFAVVYSILNLIAFGMEQISRRKELYDVMNDMKAENRTMEVYKQYDEMAQEQIDRLKETFEENEKSEVPVPGTFLALYQYYIMGGNQLFEIELLVLTSSICISIVIGIIISLSEKSKTKHVLSFILIGIILFNVIEIIEIGVPQEHVIENYIENFIRIISQYGIYYIAIYSAAFLGRYFIIKRKTNELNNELKNKQK